MHNPTSSTRNFNTSMLKKNNLRKSSINWRKYLEKFFPDFWLHIHILSSIFRILFRGRGRCFKKKQLTKIYPSITKCSSQLHFVRKPTPYISVGRRRFEPITPLHTWAQRYHFWNVRFTVALLDIYSAEHEQDHYHGPKIPAALSQKPVKAPRPLYNFETRKSFRTKGC